ncbi:MAG: flippase-like domain-containing protein [Candidatus Melainabacteria bacterium]|nr:flippase-like domain-containing protein [Candidatus Melainabacteria bacterium]
MMNASCRLLGHQPTGKRQYYRGDILVAGKSTISSKHVKSLSITALAEQTSPRPTVSVRQDTNTHPSKEPEKMSQTTKLRLKLLISVVLFASLFLFGKVSLAESWEAALNANRWYLSIAVVSFLLSAFVNAHRWQLLAHAVGLRKSIFELVQYCYVGLFFNLFLPSTVGGDFSRCYYLSKGTNKYANAFYSVVADRVVGIAVLFLMASAGILFGPGGSGLPWQLKWPIFAGTIFVFGLLPVVPRVAELVLGKHNWLSRQLNESAANVYWRDKNLMFVCLVWSILLQMVMVGCHIAVGLSLGLTSIPLWYYFVFYPSVAVLGFITPSFNGIGIREWAYTYFLMLVGVPRAHALTFAIMWLGLITLSSLVGGLVYVAGHFRIPKEEMAKIQLETLP